MVDGIPSGGTGKGRRQGDQEIVQAPCERALWQHQAQAPMLGQLKTVSGVPDGATLSPAGEDIEAERVTPDVQGHSWSRTRAQEREKRTWEGEKRERGKGGQEQVFEGTGESTENQEIE